MKKAFNFIEVLTEYLPEPVYIIKSMLMGSERVVFTILVKHLDYDIELPIDWEDLKSEKKLREVMPGYMECFLKRRKEKEEIIAKVYLKMYGIG